MTPVASTDDTATIALSPNPAMSRDPGHALVRIPAEQRQQPGQRLRSLGAGLTLGAPGPHRVETDQLRRQLVLPHQRSVADSATSDPQIAVATLTRSVAGGQRS